MKQLGRIRKLLAVAALTGVALSGASTTAWAQAAQTPIPLARAVRTALGHGNADEARRIVQQSREAAPKKAVGSALIAIYEGRLDEARAALAPLTTDDDAILELGLLEVSRGRKAEGEALLRRIIDSQADLDTDGFMRLARAADALGEINLANSVFQRIGSADTDRADVQSAWGDLFFETHAAAEAARSYQDALKADPAWIPALLGASRALEADEPAASAAMLTKAQELAPKSPDVWLLTAERQLAEQDFAAATASLDKVKAVRSNSIDELALRAAAVYATGTPRDAEPMIAAAAALNPSNPAVHRALGNQASQLYRFDDAVAFARGAVKTAPDQAGPHSDLGTYLLRTGGEAEARTELETSFKLDPYDTIVFNLLQMLDTLEKFQVIEDGPFIFKMSQASAPVLANYAIPLAREAYAEYVKRYGFTPEGPILVEIFDDHDSFAVRTAGLPGLIGALGACFGRVIAMDSPKAAVNDTFSWQGTLWHEIAHVFTLQASDYRVPRWLTEGLSQYEEHRKSAPWGRELTMQYAVLMARGETFALKRLSESFKNPSRIAMAYFEASLLAEHLEDLGGTAALRSLLASYAAGAKDADAFSKAFGKTVPEIEASFRAFTTERYGALATALKPPTPDVADGDLAALKARATAKPGSYISQMTYGNAALEARDNDEAVKAFTRAAALAPPAGGEDGPFALLANLAIQRGDKAEAARLLRHMLDYGHDNLAAARTLANLSTELNNAAYIDFSLLRVADLDPFDADVHSQLGRRELAENRPDRALLEFKAALALGPSNMADAHTDLGEAYLKKGQKDEAKREAFAALELAPTFARAQDLLLAALGRTSGGGAR